MVFNSHVVVDTGILFAVVTTFRLILHLPRPKASRLLLLLLACFAVSLASHTLSHNFNPRILGFTFLIGTFPLLLFFYRREAEETLLILLISFGLSFILYLFAIIPSAILQAQLFRFVERKEWVLCIFAVFISVLMQVFLHLLFRLPRLRNGLPYLRKKGVGVIGAFLGFTFLVIFSLLQGISISPLPSEPSLTAEAFEYASKNNLSAAPYLPFSAGITLCYIVLGIFVFFWIFSRTTREYHDRVRAREMQTLSDNLHRQMDENDRLSSLLHRDNKLLLGMQLAVGEVLEGLSTYANTAADSGSANVHFPEAGETVPGVLPVASKSPSPFLTELASRAAALRTELDGLAAERSGTVKRYELETLPLPKIGIPSADTQLAYMQKRAAGEGIFLNVSSDGTVKQFVPEQLEETELVTLLADLLENALHATTAAGGDRIFLYLGLRDGIFGIEVSDTGVPFPESVIKAYGKRRKTTRKDEGGTGIGLMTIHDILKKHGGSFHVETLPENAPYKKTLSLRFDHGKDSFG